MRTVKFVFQRIGNNDFKLIFNGENGDITDTKVILVGDEMLIKLELKTPEETGVTYQDAGVI